jgi:hypothetical protein
LTYTEFCSAENLCLGFGDCETDDECPEGTRCGDEVDGICTLAGLCEFDLDCVGDSFCGLDGFCDIIYLCSFDLDCPADGICDAYGYCVPF